MLFERNHRGTATLRRKHAIYELIYTFVDFGAAICFVIGSVMFFSDAWATSATWFFLVGSVLFAAKPTIRLIREIHLAEADKIDDLAARYRD